MNCLTPSDSGNNSTFYHLHSTIYSLHIYHLHKVNLYLFGVVCLLLSALSPYKLPAGLQMFCDSLLYPSSMGTSKVSQSEPVCKIINPQGQCPPTLHNKYPLMTLPKLHHEWPRRHNIPTSLAPRESSNDLHHTHMPHRFIKTKSENATTNN